MSSLINLVHALETDLEAVQTRLRVLEADNARLLHSLIAHVNEPGDEHKGKALVDLHHLLWLREHLEGAEPEPGWFAAKIKEAEGE